MLLSSAFLDGLILCYDDRFACTSLRKNVFEFEMLDANTSRFAPCWIRLKMCVEMKEHARAHYFGTMVAILITV